MGPTTWRGPGGLGKCWSELFADIETGNTLVIPGMHLVVGQP